MGFWVTAKLEEVKDLEWIEISQNFMNFEIFAGVWEEGVHLLSACGLALVKKSTTRSPEPECGCFCRDHQVAC